jgi:hypothetical protein
MLLISEVRAQDERMERRGVGGDAGGHRDGAAMSRGRCGDGTTTSRVLHDGRGDGEVAKGGVLDQSSDDRHVARGQWIGGARVCSALLGWARGEGTVSVGWVHQGQSGGWLG